MDTKEHTNYVLGFAFSEDGKELLVIKKTKPEWQAGKFNGIGGKIEPFEKFQTAMVREFREETGIVSTEDDWRYLGVMSGTDYTGVNTFSVHVFSMFDNVVRIPSSPTEETVQIMPVAELDRYPHIPNLDWLVPMALNAHSEEKQITKLQHFKAVYA